MNVMMDLRKCCNKLFLISGAEERILADSSVSGPHKSVQEKSAILSMVLLLTETELRILIGIQSLQNNLLSPQERWFFWKILCKICIAVGTRSLFSARWFVSLTFLRIYCTSNIPNMKGSMDQSPPRIGTVLLIGFYEIRIKGFSWYWEQYQEVCKLTYLQHTQMSFLIMIETHSWGRLFPPSVRSGGTRSRHLLSSILLRVFRVSGVLRVLRLLIVLRVSKVLSVSKVSRFSRVSRVSKVFSVSSGFRVSGVPCVSSVSRVLSVCRVWRVLRWCRVWIVWRVLSVSRVLSVWLLFLIFCLQETQKQKNRTACRHTFFFWLSVRIDI